MGKDLKISTLLDFYGEMLTDKQRDVIELYYNEDLSLAEIAEHENITRQGVRDSIKRGEQMLFSLEEKLGLAQKFMNFNEIFEDIKYLASGINKESKTYNYSRNITGASEEILKKVEEASLIF